jgi:hypothetical protein
MMLALLDYLAEALYSLNTSLLDLPPPVIEQTGQDVCYLKRNHIGFSSVMTFCKDLEDGKRFAVGSWYISPRQHVLECLICSIMCALFLIRSYLTLSKYHPPTKTAAIRPPLALRLITLVVVSLQFYYKAQGYSGKMYFWVMPCNMNWLLLFVLSFYPGLSWGASHLLLQMCVSFSGLAVIALLVPDTSDLVLPFEVPYFFTSHALLSIYPFYFVATGQISTLPPVTGTKQHNVMEYFLVWWSFACSTFGLFYFGIVTPLSIYSGINLNYMLSPPPNQNILIGPWYRFLSTIFVGVIFFLLRLVATFVEWISTRSSRKECIQQQKLK